MICLCMVSYSVDNHTLWYSFLSRFPSYFPDFMRYLPLLPNFLYYLYHFSADTFLYYSTSFIISIISLHSFYLFACEEQNLIPTMATFNTIIEPDNFPTSTIHISSSPLRQTYHHNHHSYSNNNHLKLQNCPSLKTTKLICLIYTSCIQAIILVLLLFLLFKIILIIIFGPY